MACFSAVTIFGIVLFALRKRFPRQWHINWLIVMIFGGALALTVEHIAQGESVPWPPFLTAMANPADTAAMFAEIGSVGIPMAIALVLVWAVLVVAYEKTVAVRPAVAGA